MTQSEKDLLSAYIYNRQSSLEQDTKLMIDKYNLRKCDEIDYLENIIAITREKAFNEFAFDIVRLLKMDFNFIFESKGK